LGDLLFIKKVKKPRKNYNVFIAQANEIGYNTLGHNIEDNDFDKILASYKKSVKKELIPISKLIKEDNINPWHYHPDAKKSRAKVKQKRSKLINLSDLVSVYNNRISRRTLRDHPDRKLKYSEVRDFDPETGEFKYTIRSYSTLPSRAAYELNGDELILLPNAKNSLESRRKVIKIGVETKGIILTNRFLPLRPNINIDYLVMMLNHDFVKDQLIAVCRGAGSPDFREGKLKEILIPAPDSTDLSSIEVFMETLSDRFAEIQEIKSRLSELEDLNENIF